VKYKFYTSVVASLAYCP